MEYAMTINVVLRDVLDDDLTIFFKHQLDPGANHMAAFMPRDTPQYFFARPIPQTAAAVWDHNDNQLGKYCGVPRNQSHHTARFLHNLWAGF